MGLGMTNGPGKTGYYAKQAYDTANAAMEAVSQVTTTNMRKPSTAYSAGTLVNGNGLDLGLVLLCTVGGTTSSATIDFSSYDIGDTITDGTAGWLVVSYAVSTGDAFYVGLDGNWCPSSADIIYSAYFDIGADGNLYPLEGGA